MLVSAFFTPLYRRANYLSFKDRRNPLPMNSVAMTFWYSRIANYISFRFKGAGRVEPGPGISAKPR